MVIIIVYGMTRDAPCYRLGAKAEERWQAGSSDAGKGYLDAAKGRDVGQGDPTVIK
jgi:hypothetical protein